VVETPRKSVGDSYGRAFAATPIDLVSDWIDRTALAGMLA
jgi:hypothetical protein